MSKYQDPKFDKELYWKNRKDGLRGQLTGEERALALAKRKATRQLASSIESALIAK